MQVQGLSEQYRGQGIRVRIHEIKDRALRGWYPSVSSIALVMALSACSSMGLGSANASEPKPVQLAAAAEVQTTPVAPTSSKFGPTAVGQKAAQLRADFDKLKTNTITRSQQLETIRNQTVSNVNAYHTRVGAIRSRLQMGSTPGNPELLAEWSQAQSQLTQIDADIATLNQLSTQVSSDAGSSAFILENIRAAYQLSGALEEDHRQLRVLEDEVNQNAIVIDRALLNLNSEINRQAQYVTNERTSLVQLASDINAGQSYGVNPQRRVAVTAAPRPVASVTPASFADKRPLVVIRFDKPDVQFEPALYQALSRALERRPDATFDLVAVSPNDAGQAAARRDADVVFKSMTNMGLPADRVAMAAMAQASAQTPEVHIYVH
jgi:hypothetical protein